MIDELWILRSAAGRWSWRLRNPGGETVQCSPTDWPDSGFALANARRELGFEGYRVNVGRRSPEASGVVGQRATVSGVTSTSENPSDPRTKISIRLSPASVAFIDKRAGETARSRSETIRLMLAYAAKHMPERWLP